MAENHVSRKSACLSITMSMSPAEKFGTIAATLQNLVKLTGDELVTFRLAKITSDVGIEFDDAQTVLKRLATKEIAITIRDLYFANPDQRYVDLGDLDAETAAAAVSGKGRTREEQSEWATKTLLDPEYEFDANDKLTIQVDSKLLGQAIRNFDSENKTIVQRAAEEAYRMVLEQQDAINRVRWERGELPTASNKNEDAPKELAQPKAEYLSPTGPHQIKAALEQRFKTIERAKDNWDFFLYIADYVQFIDQTKGMAGLVALIQKEREEDHKYLNEYESKFQEEVEAAHSKLIDIIRENEIPTELVKEKLKAYKDYKEKRTLSSQPVTESLFEQVSNAVETLFYKGYQKLLDDFIEVDPKSPSEIRRYTFAPTIDQYFEEKQNIEARKKTSLWYPWNELTLAYICIYHPKKFIEDLSREGRKIDLFNFQGTLHEMWEIRDRKDLFASNQPVQFIREDYEGYLLRIHNFFSEQLLSQEEAAEKTVEGDKQESLFEKDKEKSLSIDTPTDHRLFRDKWLTVKRILDVIFKRLPPLSTSSKIPFDVELSPFPEHYVEDVLKTLLDAHITSYYDPEKDTGVITTTHYRAYLQGKNIIINDREAFELFRGRVSGLYAFIEQDGRKRFPSAYGLEEIKKQALIKALREPSEGALQNGPQAVYTISRPKTRELIINGRILGKPNFESENDRFCEFIFANANRKISRQELEAGMRVKLKKTIHQIIADLGFKSELKKIFFPGISSAGVEFRTVITSQDLQNMDVDHNQIDALLQQLSEWKKKEVGRNGMNQ